MGFRFKKSIIFGFVGGFLLFGFYFLFLMLANSFLHAISQFWQIWYWILILAVGFGLQVGLYFYIRESFRQKQIKSPTAIVATSGGISTGSMIVCCLHHLIDVLPIIGLAAAFLFLIKYQTLFLVIGILSNLIGITIMLGIIQKHQLSEGFLKRILIYDVNRFKKAIIAFSLILLFVAFLLINNQREEGLAKTINLSSKTDSQGGVSFEVTPLNFNFENPVKFEIKIDTHSGSLNFDLENISILEDNKDNRYQPQGWQGSPPGGHHRSGILIFPKLENEAKKIKLTIQDIRPRIFEWNLE